MDGVTIIFLIFLGISVVAVVIVIIVRSITQKYNPIQEIEKLINANEFKKAQELTQKELLKTPNSFVLKYHMGQIFEGLQEFSQAASYYEKAAVSATAEGNEDMKPQIFLKVASLYKKKHKYEEAIGYYMMVLDKAPQNQKALLEVAEIFVETNKSKRAFGVLMPLLRIAPNNLKARYLLAQSCFQSQDYAECSEHLDFLLTHIPANDPLFPKATFLLANSLFQLKRYDEAISQMEPLFNIPEVSDAAVLKVVEGYLALNQLEKAINIAEEFVLPMPPEKKVELYYMIASAHYKKGDINLALKNWKSAAEIDATFKDLKGIISQYSTHYEHPALKHIYTVDHVDFEAFVFRMLKVKNVDSILKKPSYTVLKTHDVDYVIFRVPFSITFHDLADIETNLHNDFMANMAINIYSLYGFSDEAKGHPVFRKILEVSGEAFVKLVDSVE
ncbi:MAG: hypothetical protein A2Y33_10240 [Spirochaetes bacterium GWF1_51_8]|nr:MAG: hypothetical protein A2Y33_10240 [Spirochaetes bacterium GWF1_51_8]